MTNNGGSPQATYTPPQGQQAGWQQALNKWQGMQGTAPVQPTQTANNVAAPAQPPAQTVQPVGPPAAVPQPTATAGGGPMPPAAAVPGGSTTIEDANKKLAAIQSGSDSTNIADASDQMSELQKAQLGLNPDAGATSDVREAFDRGRVSFGREDQYTDQMTTGNTSYRTGSDGQRWRKSHPLNGDPAGEWEKVGQPIDQGLKIGIPTGESTFGEDRSSPFPTMGEVPKNLGNDVIARPLPSGPEFNNSLAKAGFEVNVGEDVNPMDEQYLSGEKTPSQNTTYTNPNFQPSMSNPVMSQPPLQNPQTQQMQQMQANLLNNQAQVKPAAPAQPAAPAMPAWMNQNFGNIGSAFGR